MRLKDKVAIVTGGAQGIGREYSLRFVEEGAAVGVVDTRYEQARMVEQEIIDRKGKALAIRTDVTSKEQLDAMAKQVFDRFGRIDILVNNAAIYYDLELGNSSIEYGRKVIDVNVFGVMLASWAVFPYMKRQRSGSIINISSIAAYPGAVGGVMLGHMPDIETPTADYYGISKVAVIHLTQSMALSFGQYNIRVNAIAPGVTMSEATKKVVPQPFIQALATQSALGTPAGAGSTDRHRGLPGVRRQRDDDRAGLGGRFGTQNLTCSVRGAGDIAEPGFRFPVGFPDGRFKDRL